MVEPLEMDLTDRTKMPQRPESPLHHHHHQQHHPPPLPQPPPIIREPHNLLPFSFFPPFPAPGLIPPPIGHPMFPRFPLPLPKGITHTHPGMANLPIPPRFLNPPMKLEDYSVGKSKTVDREKYDPSHYAPIVPPAKPEKIEKEKNEKIAKIPDKELILPVTSAVAPPPVINTPPVISPLTLPIVSPVPTTKHTKLEKVDKVRCFLFLFVPLTPFLKTEHQILKLSDFYSFFNVEKSLFDPISAWSLRTCLTNKLNFKKIYSSEKYKSKNECNLEVKVREWE